MWRSAALLLGDTHDCAGISAARNIGPSAVRGWFPKKRAELLDSCRSIPPPPTPQHPIRLLLGIGVPSGHSCTFPPEARKRGDFTRRGHVPHDDQDGPRIQDHCGMRPGSRAARGHAGRGAGCPGVPERRRHRRGISGRPGAALGGDRAGVRPRGHDPRGRHPGSAHALRHLVLPDVLRERRRPELQHALPRRRQPRLQRLPRRLGPGPEEHGLLPPGARQRLGDHHHGGRLPHLPRLRLRLRGRPRRVRQHHPRHPQQKRRGEQLHDLPCRHGRRPGYAAVGRREVRRHAGHRVGGRRAGRVQLPPGRHDPHVRRQLVLHRDQHLEHRPRLCRRGARHGRLRYLGGHGQRPGGAALHSQADRPHRRGAPGHHHRGHGVHHERARRRGYRQHGGHGHPDSRGCSRRPAASRTAPPPS